MIPDPHQPEGSRPVSVTGGQKGAGLPLAIFLITVLALITVTITQLQQSTGEMEALDTQSSRAYYAAQAGIQAARTKIKSYEPDQSCPPPEDEEALEALNTKINFDSAEVDLDKSLAECDVDDVVFVNPVNVDNDCPDSPNVSISAKLKSTGICGSGQDSAERTIEETVTVDVPSP